LRSSQWLTILLGALVSGGAMTVYPLLSVGVGLFLGPLLTLRLWYRVKHEVTWQFDLRFLGKVVLTVVLGVGIFKCLCVAAVYAGIAFPACSSGVPIAHILGGYLILVLIGAAVPWGYARVLIWRGSRNKN
jgi:hypothetical protein